MDVTAALGITIKSDGTLKAANDLKALEAGAVGAERAVAKMNKTSSDTHAAQYARAIDSATRSLGGFEAIAARAAEQADYMTRQIQQLTAWDIRNTEIQTYGREMDRLRAKFNPLFAASKQYEATLDEINYAHRVGAISAQEQAAAIARLDAQYEAAARAANTLTTANKSMQGSFHTTNLLFQAQDIAMMTAMGQAPLMLALQQGTQVGGIFHQIGNGRQIVQALGGAVMGLLNPLNLATIAVIGLGAAGVQALMSMSSQWGTTRRTFEEHAEWLNKLLDGYDDLQSSVGDFLAEANKLPASLARLELGAALSDQMRELVELQSSIADFRIRDNALIDAWGLNEQLAVIRNIKSEFDAGLITATEFSEKMRLMELNPNLHSEATRVATELLTMVRRAFELEVGIDGVRLAMEGVTQEAELAAQRMALLVDTFGLLESMGPTSGGLQNILDGQVEAFEKLTDMVPEIRTQQEIASDLLQQALSSPAEELRQQAQAAYDLFMRNTAIMDARREAERAAGKENPYQQATKAVNDNIRSLEQQALTFGLSETAATRFTTAMGLLRAAEEAKLPITSALIDEINGLANAYALAEEQARLLQQQQQLAISINNTLASGFANMFKGIIDGSKSAGEAISDLLGQLGQLLINQAFMTLFGGGTGGGVGGILAGIFSPVPGFAGGTPYAPGGMAWVGERGPELVNLPRGSQVYPHTQSMQMAANWNAAPQINIANTINVPAGTSADVAPAIAREVTKELRRQLPDAIEGYNRNPYRRHAG